MDGSEVLLDDSLRGGPCGIWVADAARLDAGNCEKKRRLLLHLFIREGNDFDKEEDGSSS